MMGCRCAVPRPHFVHPNKCLDCGRWLDPRIVDSDENVAIFHGRLEAIPGMPTAALDHARERNRTGREIFGLAYLDRNNPAEGREESADGVNYAFYDWLKGRREGREEINPHLLAAARYFALAHQELLRAERDDG
jgi:hypothetical protein